jgi:hypothetical protein
MPLLYYTKLLVLALKFVASLKTLDSAGCINNSLFTGEERMAFAA